MRCWFHKSSNVLNKLPKGLQGKAKAALQEIWMADSRAAAEKAMDAFEETYGAKYPKAAKTRGCLSRLTVPTMVFQLCRCAQKRWRKLSGYELLAKVIKGVKFLNGIEEVTA